MCMTMIYRYDKHIKSYRFNYMIILEIYETIHNIYIYNRLNIQLLFSKYKLRMYFWTLLKTKIINHLSIHA